ncbi:MAG TPA: PEGA domain-containing protein, partial [Kofleriaceae bacterium]|nr:PEGA domain-containing protein [Kofleriaceae bacterium]
MLRVLVAIALLGGVAGADDKPWAAGVSAENQAKALATFEQGNDRFIKDEWRNALDLYLEALASWDHPNIRYNAAICLIKLDRMVEAYEHMQAAMRFGEPPLGKELHQQGQTYLQVLKSSTSSLEVICKPPDGVTITVDGQPLRRCPDTKLVTPGKHQIVSEKPGYRTERREVTAPPGGRETVVIVMQIEGTRTLTRRWARWKPWAVVAGGAVIGLAGIPLYLATQGKFDDYDEDVATFCREMPAGGCAPGEADRFDGQLSSAKTWRAITY